MTPELAPGLELSGAANFLLTAGFGLYAEVGASLYLGSASTIHPIISGEGGVFFDYEVLP